MIYKLSKLLTTILFISSFISCAQSDFRSGGKFGGSKGDDNINKGAANGDMNAGSKGSDGDNLGLPVNLENESFTIGETKTSGAIDILLLIDTSYSMSNNIAKVKAGITSLWNELPDANLRLGLRTVNITSQQSKKYYQANSNKEFSLLFAADDFATSGYNYNTLNFFDVSANNEFSTAGSIYDPKESSALVDINAKIDSYFENSKKNTSVVNENGLCGALLGYQSIDSIKITGKEKSLFRTSANAYVAIVVSDEDAQDLDSCAAEIKKQANPVDDSYNCSKKVSYTDHTCTQAGPAVNDTCTRCAETTTESYSCNITGDGGIVIPKTCTRQSCARYENYTCQKPGPCLHYEDIVRERTVSGNFASLAAARTGGYTDSQCSLIAGNEGTPSFNYRNVVPNEPSKPEKIQNYVTHMEKFKNKYSPDRTFIINAISYTGEENCKSNDPSAVQATNYKKAAELTKGVVTCIDTEDYAKVMKDISVNINQVVLTYKVKDGAKIAEVKLAGQPLKKDIDYHIDLEKNLITLNSEKAKTGQTLEIFY